jgi:hypothetical protein
MGRYAREMYEDKYIFFKFDHVAPTQVSQAIYGRLGEGNLRSVLIIVHWF